MRVALAAAIALWTLVAWSGRIGLLTSGEGLGAWLRIGGSLLVALLAAATLVIPRLEPIRKTALVVFAVFTVLLWARSLIVTWLGDGSLPFKMVHSVLALGFGALAWWALSSAMSPDGSSPDEARGRVDSSTV